MKEEVLEFIECQICNENLNNSKMCPNCKKFLCLKCFQNLKIEEEMIKCPFCRIKKEKSLWRTNRYINILSQNLNNIFSKFCGIHPDDIAIHFCYDCKKEICGSCFLTKVHNNHRILKKSNYEKIIYLINDSQKYKDKITKKIAKINSQINNVKEGENILYEHLRKIKEEIKKFTENVIKECNEKINYLNAIKEVDAILKYYLENLSKTE